MVFVPQLLPNFWNTLSALFDTFSNTTFN